MQISHKYKNSHHIFDFEKKDIKTRNEKGWTGIPTGKYKSVKEVPDGISTMKEVFIREQHLYKIYYVICPICNQEIVIREKKGKRLKMRKGV